jgi:hypothetical protein
MNQKNIAIACIVFLFAAHARAQNVSSPYSVLGIGDIETFDYGRYSASGAAAVSRREAGFYNFANPASLTAMPYKAVNLDFALRGRVSKFKLPGTDTFTLPSKDMVVKRVTLAFKVTPTVGFAFGIRPFSSVNYQYSATSAISDGSASLIKYTDGSGGINQTYFSIAKQIKKRLSVGATASWLFGALQNTTTYYNPGLGLDIIKSENNFYTAAGLQGGLQYQSLPAKKWQHSFGLTATAYTQLKGQNTTDYTESEVIIKTAEPVDIIFKMPVAVSAGYSIANKNGLSVNVQASYNKWPQQKVNYSNSFTSDAYGLNAGMEYSRKISNNSFTAEKYYVGWGIKMERSYLVINNNPLNDYAVTFGAGKNISRLISVNAGIEAGKKGTASFNQIRENYFQFNAGITLKDVWYGTKRFGRYN